MTSDAPVLVEIAGVVKAYGGLRPLRVQRLRIGEQDRIALSGLDAAAAEVLVNLIAGAAVPDEGSVRVAGRDTRDIATDTEWLTSLDRFGIVTHRAVLIDGLSVAANLALPLTLSIDPMAADTLETVRALAAGASSRDAWRPTSAATLTAEERVRVHLARALAPAPSLLLLEHPTAPLDDGRAVGVTLASASAARALGYLAVSEDEAFIRASGATRLRLAPATGEVAGDGMWRRLFG